MSLEPRAHLQSPTLSFETFWEWLVSHPNCILRAGTPEVVLYDDDDFHWHFAAEGDDTLLVQLIRGKRFVGELLIRLDTVSYVQTYQSDQADEHVFELISETETDRQAMCFFVLNHGVEDEDDFQVTGRAVH